MTGLLTYVIKDKSLPKQRKVSTREYSDKTKERLEQLKNKLFLEGDDSGFEDWLIVLANRLSNKQFSIADLQKQMTHGLSEEVIYRTLIMMEQRKRVKYRRALNCWEVLK